MKYFYLFLLCFLGSCVERIDFEVERKAGQIIIDGSLTNDSGVQLLKIGETAPTSRIPLPISNAQVSLFDDQGNSASYTENDLNPGDYLLDTDQLRGEVGNTYFIEIQLQDGRTYRSKPEKMQAHQAVLDSIYYDFSVEKGVNSGSTVVFENTFINAYIDVNLSRVDGPLFIKWDVQEVFLLSPTDFPDPFGMVPPPCYVYVNTSDVNLNLFRTTGNDIPALQGLKVASQEITWRFREKHYFTVTQRSMTQEAFEYWEKANDLLSSGGNIFDVPPAPLPGNIYNINDESEEILGYFDVSSTSLIRFRTFRNDIPIDQVLECTYSPSKRFSAYPDYCLNCLSVRNSTYTRPDFF